MRMDIPNLHDAVTLLKDNPLFANPGRVTTGGRLFDNAGNRDGNDPSRPDPNKDGDGRQPQYKVELLCRTFVGDDDVRPLADGIHFWESPDIWVDGPGGMDKPQAGVVNKVSVHVWNLGLMDSTATFIDLFWCNPSVGVNAAAAHAIGTQTISLNAGEHKIVSFDWTPTFENGGHECLVAQVYDPFHDPVVAPFNPLLDRHVAQRNVFLVPTPPGKKAILKFYAANMGRRAAASTLTLEPVVENELQRLGSALGRPRLVAGPGATAGLTAPVFGAARPTVDLSQMPALQIFRETLEPAPSHNAADLIHGILGNATRRIGTPQEITTPVVAVKDTAVHTDLAATATLVQRHDLTIPPGKEAAINLEVMLPAAARIGTVQAYRVVERVGGKITGGVTFLVETVK